MISCKMAGEIHPSIHRRFFSNMVSEWWKIQLFVTMAEKKSDKVSYSMAFQTRNKIGFVDRSIEKSKDTNKLCPGDDAMF